MKLVSPFFVKHAHIFGSTCSVVRRGLRTTFPLTRDAGLTYGSLLVRRASFKTVIMFRVGETKRLCLHPVASPIILLWTRRQRVSDGPCCLRYLLACSYLSACREHLSPILDNFDVIGHKPALSIRS